ncbi:MAG TPA: hypothetical protein VFX58_14560, partial [Chitinophagaceae bacterium]|nr:hypothetical protein [Chitinophagaceae bacterium]
AAFYYTLAISNDNKKTTARTILLLAFLLLCGLTKYLFLPVVFILPLFLLARGIADKDANLKKAGGICFAVLVLALGSLLAWQKYSSGTAAYISEPGRGFFPEHLLSAYPAIPASLLKPDTLGLLINRSPATGSPIYSVYQILHLLLLVAAVIWVFYLYRQYGLRKIPLAASFVYITAAVLFTITLLLGILSLFVPKETINPGWLWTYIEEPRYYGLVNVLLHLSVFVLYRYQKLFKQTRSRFFFYFLFLLMVPDMIRGMVFDGRRILHFGKEEYSWQYEHSIQEFADSIIREQQSNYPGVPMVITGPSHYMNNRVSLYNGIPILKEFRLINDSSSLRTSEPVILLVMIHENELPNFTSFTASQPEAGSFKGYRFYIHHVKPD